MPFIAHIDAAGERETRVVIDDAALAGLVARVVKDPFTEISIEPAYECGNCDGKGRYTCWPHTKCPICEGYGWVPGEWKAQNSKRMTLHEKGKRAVSLREVIDQEKADKFSTPATEVKDSEALGVAIASFFEWDGIRILETAIAALEDANFHTEAGLLDDMLTKVKED